MTTDIERFESSRRMSKIVKHGNVIYLCGQTSVGKNLSDIVAQTKESLSRVDALLHQAGSDRSRILSALIHLRDMELFNQMNEVWEAWLPTGAAPARTTVQANLASADLLFEITITATVLQ
jgi:enamine deaminase RidA (YjgF/YER057c/UK114 family)